MRYLKKMKKVQLIPKITQKVIKILKNNEKNINFNK